MAVQVRQFRAWFVGHPQAADALLAVFALVMAVVSSRAIVATMRTAGAPFPYDGTKDVIGLALTTLPLALRRSRPLVALLGCTVGFVLSRQLLGSMEASVVTFVLAAAFYSTALHGPRATDRRGMAVVLLSAVLVLGEVAYELTDPEATEGAGTAYLVFAFAYNLALIIIMWVLGRARAAALARSAELAERTEELVAERQENARRAVLEERVRIARELHDVVAHHVSVIGVQAGAARTILPRDQGKASELLEAIEGESRQAVGELHRLLGVMRQSGDADGVAPQPQPGLAQLSTLAAAVGQSGITVAVEVEGTPRALASTVDTSAYRIVQESLTNAIKHSGATAARVRLHYTAGALELEIDDDGRGTRTTDGAATAGSPDRAGTTATVTARAASTTSTARTGLGIIGMRERAELHGGSLEVGPSTDGGFCVRATLPLREVTA